MKVTYDEKTNSDFTPFRLILEFETSEDLKVFYALIRRRIEFSTHAENEMFDKIHNIITLKMTK